MLKKLVDKILVWQLKLETFLVTRMLIKNFKLSDKKSYFIFLIKIYVASYFTIKKILFIYRKISLNFNDRYY